MSMRPTICAVLAVVGLAACVPGLPNTTPAPALGANQFPEAEPSVAGLPTAPMPTTSAATPAPGTSAVPAPAISTTPEPSPEADPFGDMRYRDVVTVTKFAPSFALAFDSAGASQEPGILLDVYQTKGELELKEMRALLENAAFRFDKLAVGMEVGTGTMDVGTPPKLSLGVTMTVTETDAATYAVIASKASNGLVRVYLSDIRVKRLGDDLQLISVSNFARGNDGSNQHTTEASARVVQRLAPGFLVLPFAGQMRTRVLMYSEPDPAGGGTALRVHRASFTITP